MSTSVSVIRRSFQLYLKVNTCSQCRCDAAVGGDRLKVGRGACYRAVTFAGCAPPPGSYEVKTGEVKGAVFFRKAERFRAAKGALMHRPAPRDGLVLEMGHTYCHSVLFVHIQMYF